MDPHSETKIHVILTAVALLWCAVLLTGGVVAIVDVPMGWSDLSSAEEPDERALASELRFENVAKTVGFNYTYQIEGTPGNKEVLTNAGVYVTDYNNNGYEDILSIGGERPVLFENDNGTFSNANVLPEIDDSKEIQAALFFDHDNDGWDDLLLLPESDAPVFLENDGGDFRVRNVGFDEVEWAENGPMGAAAADYDQNGCLDVFIIQNGNWDTDRPKKLRDGAIPDPSDDNGNPNYLFRGNCDTFELVSDAGISGDRWSLAVSFVDLTGNGYPDIHVGNDFNYDVFYVNQGDGTFDKEYLPRSNRNAMSSTVYDVTGNHELDIFVTNIYYPRLLADNTDFVPMDIDGNNLFINRGNGAFEEQARRYGVHSGGWGWAGVIADFTNDERVTIYHTTSPQGRSADLQSRMGISERLIDSRYPYLRYPAVFQQTESGDFELIPSQEVGFGWASGRGVALTDYDRSGALDIAVANSQERDGDHLTGEYRLYENNAETGRWIQIDIVSAEGLPSNGARVYVRSDTSTQFDVKHSNSHYLSQSSRITHFGVGNASSVDITVEWPDGTTEVFTGVETNRRYTVHPDGTIERVGGGEG